MCSCFVFLSCCSLLSFLEGLFLLIGLRQAAGLRFVVRLPDWMFYSLINSYSIDFIFFLLYHPLVWYGTALRIRCYPLLLCWRMLMVGFWFVHGFSLNLIRSDSINQPHFGVLIFFFFFQCWKWITLNLKAKAAFHFENELHFSICLKSIPITEFCFLTYFSMNLVHLLYVISLLLACSDKYSQAFMENENRPNVISFEMCLSYVM